MTHKLQALHSVRNVGPPQVPCYATCTCRWATEPGEYGAVRDAFRAHVLANGGDPATPFPARQS